MPSDLGKMVNEKRLELNKSIKELSLMLRIKWTRLERIEQGRAILTAQETQIIAELLGISFEDLITVFE